MRIRRIRGTLDKLNNSSIFIQDPEQQKGYWKRHGYEKLVADFGGGRGDFSIGLAATSPKNDHIMIDLVPEVLIRAVQKAELKDSKNLRFAICDLRQVFKYFDEDELDTIYLNFSDPWPKNRHFKRRLTYRERLADFSKILKKGGKLSIKTDNKALFEFSLCELSASNFRLLNVNLDLYSNLPKDNIVTEYERKFLNKKSNIYMLEAVND